jgi:hypothetical protein
MNERSRSMLISRDNGGTFICRFGRDLSHERSYTKRCKIGASTISLVSSSDTLIELTRTGADSLVGTFRGTMDHNSYSQTKCTCAELKNRNNEALSLAPPGRSRGGIHSAQGVVALGLRGATTDYQRYKFCSENKPEGSNCLPLGRSWPERCTRKESNMSNIGVAGVKKGDWVKLLVPHHDGYQLRMPLSDGGTSLRRSRATPACPMQCHPPANATHTTTGGPSRSDRLELGLNSEPWAYRSHHGARNVDQPCDRTNDDRQRGRP